MVPMRDRNGGSHLLYTRICRPQRDTPARVVLINHGSPPDANARPIMQPAKCESEAARWFLTRGYLIVESPSPQGVYASGRFIGPTGQKIETDCGAKFLRLAAMPVEGAPVAQGQIVWLSEGQSVVVNCKAITKVTIGPAR